MAAEVAEYAMVRALEASRETLVEQAAAMGQRVSEVRAAKATASA